MSYRDDLAAAHARIDQLERSLEQAESGQSGDLAPILRRLAKLEARLADVAKPLDERTSRLEKQFATVLKSAAPETPTLVENNRAHPPLALPGNQREPLQTDLPINAPRPGNP